MSSYYYQPKVDPLVRASDDADLKKQIEDVHDEFPYYGYRRIHEHILKTTGEIINEKKVRRVMKKFNLRPITKIKFKVATTDSNHQEQIYPNHIQGMMLNGVDQVWGADITYVRIRTGFLYLAVIMDLYSRRIVGWAISTSLHSGLCLEALKMAITNRKPKKGLIHHSDRGVQYASKAYINLLKKHGIIPSMSAKGNPYDNAFLESLMKTIKHDEIHLKEYETTTDVLENLPKFIEDVYNKKRLHSGIDYQSPDEFEKKLLTMALAKRPVLQL
jgi:transposase InsO family protein